MTAFDAKIAQFNLDGGHIDLLSEAGGVLIPRLEEVLATFYERALSDPDARSFFKDDERVDFARSAQKKHWERLLSGRLDDEYMASVDRIGRTHARINLPLEVYMSAYAGASSHLLEILAEVPKPVRRFARLAKTPKSYGHLVGVVSRAFAFDIEQVTSVTFAVWGEEQEIAIKHLTSAMDALSEGKLAHRIPSLETSDYPERYASLRDSFNNSLERLRFAMEGVVGTANQMGSTAQSVGSATAEFSARTESQAATLEQTSAAMTELSASVQATADGAQEVAAFVGDASEKAKTGSDVVRKAVTAMDEIKHSSNEIQNIVGLIEDIAFQTNLLALNAGVEAARAGSSGRGFAVVASEVRSLAQRSSEAVMDIKNLIEVSSKNVTDGVSFVGETGDVFSEISGMVEEIDRLVKEISEATVQQAQGVSEVTTAVGELDNVTQNNAAMAEETAASAEQLSQSAIDLTRMTAQFDIQPIDEDTASMPLAKAS
ncbi:MAG: globin-coupled sensor protein [Pseudomonadota bacterium]